MQDRPVSGTSEQRECSRGQWCGSRTVTINGDEQIVKPALGYRAFCDHDCDLIDSCLSELPGIWERLQAEIARPAATETSVHVPFGPSVPLRMDIDAAMRVTARMLCFWSSRVRATARLEAKMPPTLTQEAVNDAAGTLAGNLGVLLALQPGWMTRNIPLPSGKLGHAAQRGMEATCRHCRRHISFSARSGKWWGAYHAGLAGMTACEHAPHPGTIIQPSLALIPPGIEDEMGDAEIIRFGADFLGLFVQRDGASAGLEILHLHYWNRAVLRETPSRPEELLGVECRSCSLLALRRAEPPWHKGDPEYYSECAGCGHLMTEDEYRTWVAQLAAYHRARLAAVPILASTPVS
jgi:hypothetical protein